MGSDRVLAPDAAPEDRFNPRSRMGSDRKILDEQRASMSFNPRSRMGSDLVGGILRVDRIVSIHAPAWGATWRLGGLRTGERGFNPRSRMGSDMGDDIRREEALRVSIHAPAWGATFPRIRTPSRRTFQSTLPHGERRDLVQGAGPLETFQSTLPHGERHDGELSADHRAGVSIHAPAWGAT